MTRGWRYEPTRHSLAARGIKTKSKFRRVLEGTGKAFRGEMRGRFPIGNMDPDDIEEGTRLAREYYDANKGSIAMALMNADTNQTVLRDEFRRTGDPYYKQQMNINRVAHHALLMMKDTDDVDWRWWVPPFYHSSNKEE